MKKILFIIFILSIAALSALSLAACRTDSGTDFCYDTQINPITFDGKPGYGLGFAYTYAYIRKTDFGIYDMKNNILQNTWVWSGNKGNGLTNTTSIRGCLSFDLRIYPDSDVFNMLFNTPSLAIAFAHDNIFSYYSSAFGFNFDYDSFQIVMGFEYRLISNPVSGSFAAYNLNYEINDTFADDNIVVIPSISNLEYPSFDPLLQTVNCFYIQFDYIWSIPSSDTAFNLKLADITAYSPTYFPLAVVADYSTFQSVSPLTFNKYFDNSNFVPLPPIPTPDTDDKPAYFVKMLVNLVSSTSNWINAAAADVGMEIPIISFRIFSDEPIFVLSLLDIFFWIAFFFLFIFLIRLVFRVVIFPLKAMFGGGKL